MKKNILILGANGMLGKAAFNYLSSIDSFNVIGTVRKNPKKNQVKLNITDSFNQLDRIIKKEEIDFIINCIAILKTKNKVNYSINHTLPNHLDRTSAAEQFKLIHISTDDVFPYSAGPVNEKSSTSPASEYGYSKLKGETKSINSLTIRTSILGFSDKYNNLLDLTSNSKKQIIKGFDNQMWTGCTTVQLTKFFENLIYSDFIKIRRKSKIVHFSPLGPFTKYYILKSSIDIFNNKNILKRNESTTSITRELSSIFLPKKYHASYGTQLDNELNKLMDYKNNHDARNKTILITGGGGYIGSCVANELLKNNYNVIIYDIFIYGKQVLDVLPNQNNLTLIKGDILNKRKLKKSCKNVDYLIHLAGIVGDGACNRDHIKANKVNIIGTKVVKEVAKELEIRKFIFASSCSVYGSTFKIATENSKVNPLSTYAKMKYESENDILKDKSPMLNPTILRFTTVYGHSFKPRFDLVANLFVSLAFQGKSLSVEGGNQWRPFIHVSDIALSIVKVLNAPSSKTNRQIFNIGDNRQHYQIKTLAMIVKDIAKDKQIKVQINNSIKDKRNYKVSFDKASNILKIKSKTSFKKGLKEIYSNFEKNVYKKKLDDPFYSSGN